MTETLDLVCIGAGAMGGAILGGVRRSAETRELRVGVVERDRARREEVCAQLGLCPVDSVAAAVSSGRTLLLAVKPQQAAGVLAEAAGAGLRPEQLVISIMAGITCARMDELLGGIPRLVRVMPNLPSQVGAGFAGVAAGPRSGPAELEFTCRLLRTVGGCAVVEEELLDAVTAVSGSGPAYVFYLMENLLAAAEELGLEPGAAREMVARTVLGAARLALAEESSFAALRRRVTTPGGTTAAGVAVLDERGADRAFRDCVAAAARRSRELSNMA